MEIIVVVREIVVVVVPVVEQYIHASPLCVCVCL